MLGFALRVIRRGRSAVFRAVVGADVRDAITVLAVRLGAVERALGTTAGAEAMRGLERELERLAAIVDELYVGDPASLHREASAR